MIKTVDFKGHNGHPLGLVLEYSEKGIGRYSFHMISKDWSLLDLLNRLVPEDNSKESTTIRTMIQCSACDEYLQFALRDTQLEASTVCAYPGGMQPYAVNLDAPSGKIVFANDLRSLCVIEEPEASVNSQLGCRQTTEAYARDGMIHILVGNTCPNVYRVADGYIIARLPDPDDKDSLPATIEPLETFGSICTDLWWISAMDHDLFLDRCKSEGCAPGDFGHFVVEVPSGTYAFIDHLADRHADEIIHASFKRLSQRHPLVPRKILSEYDAFTGVLKSHRRQHLSGYDILDFILTCNGNGLDWIHGSLSNQTRREDVPYKELRTIDDRDHPRIKDIPEFVDFTTSHPLNIAAMDYAGPIGNMPLDVNIYFLASAMMFAKSAIRHAAFDKDTDGCDILSAALVAMCEIADKRQLFEHDLPKVFDTVATEFGGK